MELTSVNCNNCGAPLEVAAGTNFVTCGHCGSRLAVKRTGSSAYTELLEKLDQKTDAMAEQLAEIVRQNELERIDREWEREQQRYMITTKHGARHEPNAVGGMVMAVVMAVFGVFWIGFTASMGAPGFFPAFGVIFIIVAIGSGVWQMNKASEYEAAKTAYQRRRRRAMAGEKENDANPGLG